MLVLTIASCANVATKLQNIVVEHQYRLWSLYRKASNGFAHSVSKSFGLRIVLALFFSSIQRKCGVL